MCITDQFILGIFVWQYFSYSEGCLCLSFRISFAVQMMLRLIKSHFLISDLFSIILRSACDWWQSVSFWNIPLEFPRIHTYTWNFILLGISFGVWCCCRKGDPFQGLKVGSCLTLRNELSKETPVLTKQEILLGKGTRVESSRVREPRRTALSNGLQSQVLWWWD